MFYKNTIYALLDLWDHYRNLHVLNPVQGVSTHIDRIEDLGVGCPTTYSCHVDSVLLNSKFEANRSEY